MPSRALTFMPLQGQVFLPSRGYFALWCCRADVLSAAVLLYRHVVALMPCYRAGLQLCYRLLEGRYLIVSLIVQASISLFCEKFHPIAILLLLK